MVKLLILSFLLMLNLVHAANLELELSKNQLEMGKHLTATFSYEGDTKPEQIDLGLWQDDFYIEQGDAELSYTTSGAIISTTKARLYPRHSGNITLDAIALGGSFVKPQHIKVSPSIRNKRDATPSVDVLKSHYWADEPITIRINAPLHDALNQVIAKEWLVNGFIITQLPSIKTATNVQLKWIIYTPFKGQYALELPAIVQRGKGRFRFHLPKLHFTVKPLPAYLPSSVASGSIKISSEIIHKKQHKVLQLRLKKIGHLPEEIEGFQAFINALSENELALNIQQENSVKQGVSRRKININLPNWLWNPDLKLTLSTFNTQTGRLQKTQHPLPKVNTIPPPAQHALIAIGILSLLIALSLLNKIAKKWHQHQQLKKQLNHAKNAQELRLILLSNQPLKTLSHWAYKTHTADAIKIRDLLNQACYQADSNMDLKAIKSLILTKLKFDLKGF